jgi:hypothetical protein
MRLVPAHPASTDNPGHNPVTGEPHLAAGTPLAIDLSLENLELCGAASVSQLERSLVRRAPGWALDNGL